MRKNCQDFLQDYSAMYFFSTMSLCSPSEEKKTLKSLKECQKLLARVLELTSKEIERLQSTELSRLNPNHLEQIGSKITENAYFFRATVKLFSTLQKSNTSSAVVEAAENLLIALEESTGKHLQLISDFEEIVEARLYGRSKKRKKSTKPKGIQLKVYLTNSKPQVWRRLRVPAEATLGDLNQLIRKSMNWETLDRHEFTIRDVVYSDGNFDCDEDGVTLAELNLRPQTKIEYMFDAYAKWHVTIEFEKRLAAPHDCLELVESDGISPPPECGGLKEYHKA